MTAFNTSLSGLAAAEKALRVRSNNIANASTTGYKKARMDLGSVAASGIGDAVIGSGVNVQAIKQIHKQGTIEGAEGELDMAIDGEGFFVLRGDNIPDNYTRAGNFQLDNQGVVGDGQGRNLVGYITDADGVLSGQQGVLTVASTILKPKSSTSITAKLNLDASEDPPSQAFIPGFTLDNPPAANTYNRVSTVAVYDSLGEEHQVTSYFVKAPLPNTWRVYVGVDGVDVTPTADTPPAGGSVAAPAPYDSGEYAIPFTMIFDSAGNYIENSPGSPPEHYGSLATGGAYPVSASGGLTAMNGLPTIDNDDLKINGVPIIMSTITDSLSYTDNAASAISLAYAINQKTNLHGVTAQELPTSVTLSAASCDNTAIAAGELVINGVDIVGSFADLDALVAYLNGPPLVVSNVSAANDAGDLVLTSALGVNITIQTDGTGGAGSFTSTEIQTDSVANVVQKAELRLTIPGEQPIIIAGETPSNAGFTVGAKYGVVQTSSDPITITFDPASGATDPQNISIDYNSSSQYGSAFAIQSQETDGYETGRLSGIGADENGIITAKFTNNEESIIGQVALARFANENGLKDVGRTSFEQTRDSGLPLLGIPKSSSLGTISAGALERSNVNLTDELVGLIEAQRDFGANAQSLRTADQMTQIIINLR